MTISLRPYLPADAAIARRIFQESVEELGEEEYSEAQCAAWAAAADDAEAFARRLANALTLVALEQGQVVGFAALKDDKIDMLYVHPRHIRRGAATALIDALEKLAQARAIAALQTDASDVARDFFSQRGYEAQSRNSVIIGDEWLANTTMKKKLATIKTGLHS